MGAWAGAVLAGAALEGASEGALAGAASEGALAGALEGASEGAALEGVVWVAVGCRQRHTWH